MASNSQVAGLAVCSFDFYSDPVRLKKNRSLTPSMIVFMVLGTATASIIAFDPLVTLMGEGRAYTKSESLVLSGFWRSRESM